MSLKIVDGWKKSRNTPFKISPKVDPQKNITISYIQDLEFFAVDVEGGQPAGRARLQVYGALITVPEVPDLSLADIDYPGSPGLQISGIEHLQLGGKARLVVDGDEATQVTEEITFIEEYEPCITDIGLNQRLPIQLLRHFKVKRGG